MRSRRTCLSVPGASAKMLAKAPSLGADEAVLDLEDAVAEDRKDAARDLVAAAVRDADWAGGGPAVRINATDTRHAYLDVIALVERAGHDLASIVVPKVETAGDLVFVDRLLGMVEATAGRARPVALQALVETATGLRNVHEIAHASPRLEALIVGYADLGASLGRPRGDGPDRWGWVRETVLVAARDAGVQAIDGPWLRIDDLDGLRAAAAEARALGYDGKWAIHPAQVGPLNEVFTPSTEEFAHARAVLDALAAAAAEGRGVVSLDGEMLDEALRKQAAEVVARGAAGGLGG